jgi:hypothetical protein
MKIQAIPLYRHSTSGPHLRQEADQTVREAKYVSSRHGAKPLFSAHEIQNLGKTSVTLMGDTLIENPEVTGPSVGAEQQPSSDSATGKDFQPKGVVRNLLEGHYEGVADLRLRINFHEEIQAIEEQAQLEAAEMGAERIIDAVSTNIDELLESFHLSEEGTNLVKEILASFDESVTMLVGSSSGVASEYPEELETQIRMAFETMIKSLQSTLVTVEPAKPPEDVPKILTLRTLSYAQELPGESASKMPVNPEDLQPSSTSEQELMLDAFFGELRESFETSLGDLLQAVRESEVMPELSEPRGKGVAYKKFLAIYNEINGLL